MAGWSSLPRDVVLLLADRLIADNDIDCYMHFRAVCRNWRKYTVDPSKEHPQDPRFQPKTWAVLKNYGYLNGNCAISMVAAVGLCLLAGAAYQIEGALDSEVSLNKVELGFPFFPPSSTPLTGEVAVIRQDVARYVPPMAGSGDVPSRSAVAVPPSPSSRLFSSLPPVWLAPISFGCHRTSNHHIKPALAPSPFDQPPLLSPFTVDAASDAEEERVEFNFAVAAGDDVVASGGGAEVVAVDAVAATGEESGDSKEMEKEEKDGAEEVAPPLASLLRPATKFRVLMLKLRKPKGAVAVPPTRTGRRRSRPRSLKMCTGSFRRAAPTLPSCLGAQSLHGIHGLFHSAHTETVKAVAVTTSPTMRLFVSDLWTFVGWADPVGQGFQERRVPHDSFFSSMMEAAGDVYAADRYGSIVSTADEEGSQLGRPSKEMIRMNPTIEAAPSWVENDPCHYLVESAGALFLVSRRRSGENRHFVEVHKADTTGKILEPVTNFGRRAIFVSQVRSFFINAFATIEAGCIYFTVAWLSTPPRPSAPGGLVGVSASSIAGYYCRFIPTFEHEFVNNSGEDELEGFRWDDGSTESYTEATMHCSSKMKRRTTQNLAVNTSSHDFSPKRETIQAATSNNLVVACRVSYDWFDKVDAAAIIGVGLGSVDGEAPKVADEERMVADAPHRLEHLPHSVHPTD
ncbi:hypothetical protein EJB05_18837, partial [Eragrostis curvula]